MEDISKYFSKFDSLYQDKEVIESFVSIHTDNLPKTVSIKRSNGKNNEQYYKWKLLFALIHSGWYPKVNIGTEVQFPKGNKSSAALKLDAAIFDDHNWFEHYKKFWESNASNLDELDWLQEHLLVAIEIKQEDNKNIQEVWDKQLKSYLKESNRFFCLGILYDTDRIYLFQKKGRYFIRYNESLNDKGDESKSGDLNLNIPDPYYDIPKFETIINNKKGEKVDISKRNVEDLNIISSLQSTVINDAMSNILNVMTAKGLIDQRGYNILIEILALKIFDEKRNQKYRIPLKFYIYEEEYLFSQLTEAPIQEFIKRINSIESDAKEKYRVILSDINYDMHNINHVRLICEIVFRLQDYSFVRSEKTDLYQIIFYQFANKFATEQNAQFLTPIPLIQFIVDIVNPRNNESVTDPTCGIADFLSVSYVSSNSQLDDNNIYGLDVSNSMIVLSTLNMLLNGDGNATLKQVEDMGSINHKFADDGSVITLDPQRNKDGNWDVRVDDKKIKKFDVVLTNPPFGEDRAFKPRTDAEKKAIECYELWSEYNSPKIDLGVVFLENAYHILKENGRMGIILSNSIASIDNHQKVRNWLAEKMRIVALFDLPPNVFAETGVNTTIIIAYKPSEKELKKLKESNYEIYVKDIQNVGYEVVTVKRVKKFKPKYKVDEKTFKYKVDINGKLIRDEDFSSTVEDFREWCRTQEETLSDLFVREK